MNPRQLRLVVCFLAIFVLISVAPVVSALPASFAGLRLDPDVANGLGDLGLTFAAGMVLAVGLIVTRRRLLARRARRPQSRPSQAVAVARRESGKDTPVVRNSELTRRLRKRAKGGARIPELARTFGLSQDAVRSALGQGVTPPAAPGGSSFRNRKAATPAKPAARAVAVRRSAYQALA